MTTNKQPLFVYLRKSSRKDEKQALSIPRQRAELAIFTKKEGLTIKREFVEKESAKSVGRPIFNEMLRRIEAGEAAGIVSWHPDRLSRNAVDGGNIIDFLDRGKITVLKFPTFWFENNPQGRFMLMMAFAQSTHYVDALSVNTKSGLDRKVARGEFPGAARVGYLNDRRTKRIVVDRSRAPFIKAAFERYATGSDSIDDIRDFLFENGITAVGHSNRPMPRARIGKILCDPLYYGSFRWNGEVRAGIHEPIVSRDLFDRVQAVREKRVRFQNSKPELKKFPYRATLKCLNCGSSITAESQKGYTYYRCSRKMKRSFRCTEPYVREETLDVQIAQLLKPYSLSAKWGEQMIDMIGAEKDKAAEQAVTLIDQNSQKIAAINSSLVLLQDGLVDGVFDHEYVRTKRVQLVAERRHFEAKNTVLATDSTAWLEPFREFISTAMDIAKTVNHGSKEARAVLARKIFGSNLVLSARKPHGKAVNPWSYLTQRELGDTVVPLWNAARTYFQGHIPGLEGPLPPYRQRRPTPAEAARRTDVDSSQTVQEFWSREGIPKILPIVGREGTAGKPESDRDRTSFPQAA